MIFFEENQLKINDKIVFFDKNIKKIITLEKAVLVLLLETPGADENMKSNLFLYSKNGEKIWEAQLPIERYPSSYFPKKRKECYDEIGIDSNGRIYAGNFDSFCFIDVNTGKIEETHVNK